MLYYDNSVMLIRQVNQKIAIIVTAVVFFFNKGFQFTFQS